MGDLQLKHFGDFFKAVHKTEPFPWQEELAQTVFEVGWPRVLDVPTGAGKTAVIDIAIFHLALEAERGTQRRAAIRILFVVDRRLIVDGAYGRAARIADALSRPGDPVVEGVADRLKRLAEKAAHPLAVARLRGGMPKEPDWVRTPAQPTVVVSTVDQVGSRFLFRGYGVSDTMKPVHAGLLGADSLLFLDEAHLSQPFLQTVRDSVIFRTKPWSEDRARAAFDFVTLSATPAAQEISEQQPFRISERDRSHPQLARRLHASKPAELLEVNLEADLEHGLAEKAWEFRDLNGAASITAVVTNRVARARAIFKILLKKGALTFEGEPEHQASSSPEAALLVGRIRAFDRDKLMLNLLPFMRAVPDGEPRPHRGNPLIIVATQCIEAGADLDFDALVTEIAPLDCLRQRFGRLNRMGRAIPARGAILAAREQLRKHSEDQIYGQALRNTWEFLAQKNTAPRKKKVPNHLIDFGIEASETWFPRDESAAPCLSPKKRAPVLMPSAADLWSRTSPIPFADPEVALYLHGPKSSPGDVEIVWRQDLDDSINPVDKEKTWTELVRVCPPASSETISVPIAEARNWLRGTASADIADAEFSSPEIQDADGAPKQALCWRGADQSKLVGPNTLSPGNVLVVPSSRGGCDQWGWNPRSAETVPDVAREANRQQRHRDILRLSKAELGDEDLASLNTMLDSTDAEVRDHFKNKFENLDERGLPKLIVLRSDRRVPLAIIRKLPQNLPIRGDASVGDAVTEDDESVRTLKQKPVLLADHSKGVEEFARCFATQSGLPGELIDDIALAGYLHDTGKAHPNFKCFLYGGDELAAMGPDLAKSAKLPANSEWDELRRRSGLPRGARHEVASLTLVEAHHRFALAHDRDLVLWLVGTHHGFGRPFFPAPENEWPQKDETFVANLDGQEVKSLPAFSMAELTGRWFELWERVTQRYGIWGLARLEAILRLADHRESESEQAED